eukprot:scaffold39194_cov106-Phaeocystis_antarctica.AAC.1
MRSIAALRLGEMFNIRARTSIYGERRHVHHPRKHMVKGARHPHVLDVWLIVLHDHVKVRIRFQPDNAYIIEGSGPVNHRHLARKDADFAAGIGTRGLAALPSR